MGEREQDHLLRHSALLLAATQVANVSNLLFQVVMGRALAPEQYGVLAAMLGVALMLGTPMDALRTVVAHFSARLAADGRSGEVRGLLGRWFAGLTLLAAPVAVAALLFNGELSAFFQLGAQRWPIPLTGAILAGSFYLPLFSGALQGVQAFGWMAVAQHSWGVVRLAVAAALVLGVAPRAEFGLLGQVAGVAASAALGWLGLRAVLGENRRTPSEAKAAPGMMRYFGFSLLALGGFAVLMNADIVMVKRYFDPVEAGLFARAGTIGRAVVFISMPVALAMFPKVTSVGDVRSGSRLVLAKALGLAALIILAAVSLVALWPRLPLLVLFRDAAPDAEMIRLVRWVTWAMSPLGLVYLLIHFELAQHRFGQAMALAGCALLYVAMVAFRHDTVRQVVAALALAAGLAAAVLVVGAPWRPTATRPETPP